MDERTIVITCAGGGGANNLIRSIRASRYGDHVSIVGVDANKYLINKSEADENYVVPKGGDPGYVDALNEIAGRHDVDLVIPQHESEIRTVSANRDDLESEVVLPNHETVDLCLDKFRLNKELERHGFPVPKTLSLEEHTIDEAFDRLVHEEEPLWCRTRYGSSSFEAQPMYSREQTRQWVDYWSDRRGMDQSTFTLSEFLPGRDFHILTFWNEGELLLGKGNERNQYFFGENTGVATPLVGRQLYDEELNRLCTEITEAIDPLPTGNFGFDFKEDPSGEPKLTEINIGKFSMVNYFFNMTGSYNMAELFLDVAFGNEEELPSLDDPFGDVDTDLFLCRGIDLLPDVFSHSEIEAVEDLSER